MVTACDKNDVGISNKLNGQGHNGMTYNEEYKVEIKKILTNK